MKYLYIVLLTLISVSISAQNLVIVIIDGARYTETFGDESATHIPNMAELAKKGSLLTEFYNDSLTFTSAAIPAIWCGAWTERIDTFYNNGNTQYTVKPSLFEYFRKQKGMPASKCLYSLKYVSSLWLPSFHSEYGPDYWPNTISQGDDDNDVLNNSIEALLEDEPEFSIIYFADVDHYGHSGNWNDYVQSIKDADKAVHDLWNTIQNHSFYKDNTVLIVTNDHGRHDDLNGGFRGHGCSCQGCRKIMFLAIGPGIKENFKLHTYHKLPDIAVTAASILGVDAEYATGNVINEIFTSSGNIQNKAKLSWYVSKQEIVFNKKLTNSSQISIYTANGSLILKEKLTDSHNTYKWNYDLASGLYIISVESNGKIESRKIAIP